MNTRAMFLAGCMLLTSAAPVLAAEKGALDRIRERGAINLGYMQDAVPFSFLGADKQAQGYSVELCREVARGIREQLKLDKLEARWVPITIDERIESVKSGKVDIECSTTTWTLSRNAAVDFSLITFVDGGSILAKAAGNPMSRFQDFDGRKVAVIAGTTTEKVLRASLAQRKMKSEVITVPTRGAGLKLLEDARVDGFAADRTTLIGIAATTPGKGSFVLLDEDFSVEPYALALPRGDPEFRLAVNRVLARLYRDGDIVRIYNRWLGSLGPPSVLLSATYYIQGLSE
ncbi:MAG TPA: amino acid ABC transporter substrate-binding protein [Burkholderiales bacterium]|nr:amino acid ABC transporter substrate-binding protein [Burkholderiales bacterium]